MGFQFRKPHRIGITLAAIFFLSCLALEPLCASFDNTNILVEEAVNHIYQRRFKQAHEVLKRAYEQSPRHPSVHFNLGRLFELTGNFQEALKGYQLAASLDPSLVAARRGVARCSVELKKSQLQSRSSGNYVRELPQITVEQGVSRPARTSAPIISQPGRVIPPSAPVQQAAAPLPAINFPPIPATAQSPAVSEIRLPPLPDQITQKVKSATKSQAEMQAESLIEKDDHNRALELLHSQLLKEPDNPRLHYLMGKAFNMQGELFSAIKHLEEAIKVDENFHNAYYLLAQNYSKVNLLDDALKNYLLFFAVKPQAGVAIEIARVYERMGQSDHAIEYYQKADAMNPGNPNLQSRLTGVKSDLANDLYLRANHSMSLNDFNAALSLFQQALATPGLSDVYLRDATRKIEIARLRLQQEQQDARPAREGFANTRKVYGTVNLKYSQLSNVDFSTKFTGPVTVEWRGYVAKKFSRYGRDFLLMIKELDRDELDELNRFGNDYKLSKSYRNQPLFLVSAQQNEFPAFIKEGKLITFTGTTDWKFFDVLNDVGETVKLPSFEFISAFP